MEERAERERWVPRLIKARSVRRGGGEKERKERKGGKERERA